MIDIKVVFYGKHPLLEHEFTEYSSYVVRVKKLSELVNMCRSIMRVNPRYLYYTLEYYVPKSDND